MRTATSVRLITVGAAGAILCGCGSPIDPDAATAANSIAVTDAWVTASDRDTTFAYATLKNSGETDVTIVSASSGVAERIDLESVVYDGRTDMAELQREVVIPAGASYRFEPGGRPITLVNLLQPIHVGNDIGFMVSFSDNSTLRFEATAEEPGERLGIAEIIGTRISTNLDYSRTGSRGVRPPPPR